MATRSRGLLALWAAVTIWASTFVVSKDALADVGPAALTVSRFAVASALLVVLLKVRTGGVQGLFRREHAICGLTGVALYFGLQNWGLQLSSAGTAALLQAGLPVATTLLAALWLRERPTLRELAGSTLVVLGIVLVVGTGIPRPGLGEFAILLGVVAYACYTAFLRRQEGSIDAVLVAAGSAVYGTLFLAPWLAWEVTQTQAPSLTVTTMAAVVYLGTIASAATLVLWTIGVSSVRATTAGAFTGAIPALGYLFALGTGEEFSLAKLAGGVTAVVGVLLACSAVKPLRDDRSGLCSELSRQ